MFSFHRPRVYRSVSGCCICRAKSSSSRFTDSKRYEDVFFECFRLKEVRSGEICNACVLLVKRWKKLPKGSQRHWHHVVDARAGHGSKPLSKINKNKLKSVKIKTHKPKIVSEPNCDNPFQLPLDVTETIKKKLYIPKNNRKRVPSPSGFSDDIHLECLSSESGSYHSSLETSPVPSPVPLNDMDHGDLIRESAQGKPVMRRRRGTSLIPKRNRITQDGFLDLTFWKREKTCCGTIFKGLFGEVLIDRRYLNPCGCRSTNSSSLPSPDCEDSTPLKAEKLSCYAVPTNFDEDSRSTDMETFGIFENESGKPGIDSSEKLIMGAFVASYDSPVD